MAITFRPPPSPSPILAGNPLPTLANMDSLEGALMVPPDRGQILNRAVWKVRNLPIHATIRPQLTTSQTRHVVISRRAPAFREQQNNPSYSQLMTTSRIVSSGKQQSAPPPAPTINDEYCISIFKSKVSGRLVEFAHTALTIFYSRTISNLIRHGRSAASPTVLSSRYRIANRDRSCQL